MFNIFKTKNVTTSLSVRSLNDRLEIAKDYVDKFELSLAVINNAYSKAVPGDRMNRLNASDVIIKTKWMPLFDQMCAISFLFEVGEDKPSVVMFHEVETSKGKVGRAGENAAGVL